MLPCLCQIMARRNYKRLAKNSVNGGNTVCKLLMMNNKELQGIGYCR